jgi:hypothetical protein
VFLPAGGCSSYSHGTYTLARLHIPHLQWLQALSRFPSADGTPGGNISGLAAFLRPGTSTPQVVLNRGTVYLSGLEGQGRHSLTMGDYCGELAVTADGKWIACVSNSNPTGLQVAALNASGTTQVHHVGLETRRAIEHPTWSPDGQYLAVVLDAVAPPCSVGIYASPTPHTAFTLALQVTSAQFSDQPYCNVNDIVWSADGQSLMVLDSERNTFLMTVAVGPLLQAFTRTSIPLVVHQDISQDHSGGQVLPFPSRGLFLNPAGDTVLSLSGRLEQVISYNLHTHHTTPLFTLPAGIYIDALTWLPSGTQFLLAVNVPPCVDQGCGSTLSDVYLYTLM